MKKFMFISCLCLLTINTWSEEDTFHEDITIHDVSSMDSEKLHDLFINSLEDVILKFPQGLQFPIKLHVKGDVLELSMFENKPLLLEFKQTTYLKFVYDTPFISFDLMNWEKFYQFGKKSCELNISTFGEIPLGELNFTLFRPEK